MTKLNFNVNFNVTVSTATKLYIVGVSNLDPITVFLEDLEPGKGKITITCFGESWTAQWGAMREGLTVAQFASRQSLDYIISCFDNNLSWEQYSPAQLMKEARKAIICHRKNRVYSKKIARILFEEARDLQQVPSMQEVHIDHSDFMYEVFGEEWWEWVHPVESNPEYVYMERIVRAVQRALGHQEENQSPIP